MDRSIRERYRDAIRLEAMDRYGIGAQEIESWGGFESFIYRFTRGDEAFILRLTHTLRRSADLIRGEVDWINYLAANGLTVARAIPSKSGRLVEEIDDGLGDLFLATAFAFAPGRPPDEVNWTPALNEAYGRLLGRMHALAKRYEPAYPARRDRWPDHNEVEIPRLLEPHDPAAADCYRNLLRRVSTLPRDRDTYGIIHFDAHKGNFFVDGDTITLFDFDDCCYNWFANDIAMVIFYEVTNQDDPAASFKAFWPHFMRGYSAENDLAPEWAEIIQDFMTIREIDLYAVIMRSFGVTPGTIDELQHEWPRRFMQDRQRRIAAGERYLDADIAW